MEWLVARPFPREFPETTRCSFAHSPVRLWRGTPGTTLFGRGETAVRDFSAAHAEGVHRSGPGPNQNAHEGTTDSTRPGLGACCEDSGPSGPVIMIAPAVQGGVAMMSHVIDECEAAQSSCGTDKTPKH